MAAGATTGLLSSQSESAVVAPVASKPGLVALALPQSETLVVMTYTLIVAALPFLVPRLFPLHLAVVGFAAGSAMCLGIAMKAVEAGRRATAAAVKARQELEEAAAAAEAERAPAEQRALRAEEIRRSDAERLAALQEELRGFGDDATRAERVAAGDLAGTRAAEQAFYDGQAAAAWAALEGYHAKAEALRHNDIPNAAAQFAGLDSALKEAQSQKERAETDRQTVDSSAEKLNKEAEELRKLFLAQKEELQLVESELEVLQKSAEEAKKVLREETEKQLKLMDRAAVQDVRSARWASRQTKATEAGNEVLRAALAEQDSEKAEAEARLYLIEQERGELDKKLDALRNTILALEEAARARNRAEKEIAKLRERREKTQQGVEDLKSEVKQAKAAVAKAESDAKQAVASAERSSREAEKRERTANEETKALGLNFKNQVDNYNSTVTIARREHAELCDMAKKEQLLRQKLVASEQEKTRLRLELQRVLGVTEEPSKSE